MFTARAHSSRLTPAHTRPRPPPAHTRACPRLHTLTRGHPSRVHRPPTLVHTHRPLTLAHAHPSMFTAHPHSSTLTARPHSCTLTVSSGTRSTPVPGPSTGRVGDEGSLVHLLLPLMRDNWQLRKRRPRRARGLTRSLGREWLVSASLNSPGRDSSARHQGTLDCTLFAAGPSCAPWGARQQRRPQMSPGGKTTPKRGPLVQSRTR